VIFAVTVSEDDSATCDDNVQVLRLGGVHEDFHGWISEHLLVFKVVVVFVGHNLSHMKWTCFKYCRIFLIL
jgi:hypothetical protein